MPALGGQEKRLTTLKNALNPVWGPKEIVFDRFGSRRNDAPAYNLWALDPAAPDTLRQLTKLKIPPLVSGLVPLEISADSKRLLAVFTGQDVQVGLHGRDVERQDARALAGLRERHRRVRPLARRQHDPRPHRAAGTRRAAHDVVKVPWQRGGKPKVIVEGGAYPDWTR